MTAMYLEADLVTEQAPTTSNGTTKQRLSTIELTMITGVLISAISLALNIMNTMRKTAS